MLPNSAISWGFKIPTTVCDSALVNTKTELKANLGAVLTMQGGN